MIEKMTRYSFVVLSADADGFLQELQKTGIVDIKRSAKPVDARSGELLALIGARKEEMECIAKCSDASILDLQAKKAALEKEAASIEPWGEYDADALRALGLSLNFYAVPSRKYQEDWEERWAVQKVSETDGTSYFVIIGDNSGFPLKPLPAPARTPSGIAAEIAAVQAEIAGHTAELENRKGELPALQRQVDDLTAQLGRYLASVTGESAAESILTVFEGFAPTSDDEALQAELDKMDVVYLTSAATTEDKPPIKLRNNWFTRQFEVLTGMYGMPVYNEFDPTVFLSIFFLLFFAMCMGDAGYGLLLIAIGLFLKGKSGGLAKLWSLIVTLGAGTVVVGLVMGGFFGMDLSTKAWVPGWLKSIMITGDITIGGSTYAKQMVLALLIGVLHLCLAMIMKAVWAVKRDGFKNSLGTLGWTLLIVGGIVCLSIGLPGIISESAMKWLLIGIAGVSALGIYLFNKWGRNPLMNIGAGLWDTYSMASGLMGDVLSYIRLYALGLSGGMLGSTFNQIAEMVKGPSPTWQWLPFILIIIIGHALNLAMSCLGAFVHPLRLNFVEFFKKSDYQGRGRQYNPLKQ